MIYGNSRRTLGREGEAAFLYTRAFIDYGHRDIAIGPTAESVAKAGDLGDNEEAESARFWSFVNCADPMKRKFVCDNIAQGSALRTLMRLVRSSRWVDHGYL